MATDGTSSFVLFIYADIQWPRSGRVNIGFNAGDGVRSYMLPLAFSGLEITVENTSNIDLPGVYMFRVDGSQVQLPEMSMESIEST